MSERSIFIKALEQDEAAERAALLDQECGSDRGLRDRVERLLAAHAAAGGILDKPPVESPATDLFRPITEGPGTLVGPYKLLQQIGEGGFGVVYMAEQQEPVRRKVALKIIKPGMDTKEVIARFESERQALALMDHPNIARVLDAGATESGRPYFVMELVKGVPITEYCDKNNLPTEKRLELFITVCHAVQHAHQKGVIHRDIKPSNVMVTLHDGQPVPKVIDFGVAKATSQRLTERTLFTAYGQMVGTPAYMSPEQAEMSGLDIDTRSDTYSLGVLLYELLTGTTPFDGRRLREAGYVEMQRIIREEEPPRPSTRVSTLGEKLTVVSSHRSTDPAKLRLVLRGDLDLIVMKAMEKERSRRYDTPNSFADDIQRYLGHEAILARPASAAYRLKKFVQRNKAAVVTATAIAAMLLVGTVVSTGLAIHALGQRNLAHRQQAIAESAKQDAERQRDTAEKAKQAEGEQRQLAEQQKQEAEAARLAERELREAAERKRKDIERQNEQIAGLNQQLQSAAEQQRRTLYTAQMNLIPNAWTSDNIPWMFELLNSVRPRAGQGDLRGFEWHYWQRLAHSDLRTTQLDGGLRASAPPVFSADAARLARYTFGYGADRNYKHTIRVWDTDKGRQIWSLDIPAPAPPTGSGPTESGELWLSPDGQRVALILTTRPGSSAPGSTPNMPIVKFQVFEIGSPTPLFTIQEQVASLIPAASVGFSRDGTRLAVPVTLPAEGDLPARDAVKVWDARSGQESAAIVLGVAMPAANLLGTSSRGWGWPTLNADGSRMALGSNEGVQIFDVASQEVITQIPGMRGLLLEFSPDGNRLAGRVVPLRSTGDASLPTPTIKIWDATSGAELVSFTESILRANFKFSPDGKWLALLPASTAALRSVQLHSTSTGTAGPQFKGHAAKIVALTFSPDSARLISAGEDGVIKEWDIVTAERALTAGRLPATTYAMTSGSRVQSGNIVAVAPDGQTVVSAPRTVFSTTLTASPEEVLAATQRITVRASADTSGVQTIDMSGAVEQLTFSGDGRRFAAAARLLSGEPADAGEIKVFDAATLAERLSLRVPTLEREIAARPGVSPPPSVLSTQRLTRTAGTVALSPDGRFLANSLLSGAGVDARATVRIVEVDTGRVMATGDALPPYVGQLIYSPDGSRLLARCGRVPFQLGLANASGTQFTVLDARTARTLWNHSGTNWSAAFGADGKQICAYVFRPATQGQGSVAAVHILDAATGQEQAQFPVPVTSRFAVTLSPDGKRLATSIPDPARPNITATDDVSVWDVTTRSLACILKGHSGPVTSIAFSPDSRRIATSAGPGTFGPQRAESGETKLWDAETGQELLLLADGTNNLAFSADGRQLIGHHYTSSDGLRVHRWEASPLAPGREAALLVEAFFSKPSSQRLPLKAEALALIEADKSLSAAVRAAAQEQVRIFRRNVAELNVACWLVASLPGQPREQYERALAYALEGCEAAPKDLSIWNTRGVAHYRLGQYNEALAALNHSVELNSPVGVTHPEDLAFLAMTHQHLGDKPKAEDFLRRCREAISASGSTKVAEWRGYLGEAEALLGVQAAAGSPHIAGWGEVVDPLGDCTAKAGEGTLAIAVPGTYHDLSTSPDRKNLDAPRVLREVDGDFSIQVKVACPLDPRDRLLDSSIAYHGAGLLIWQDDTHFLRVERNAYRYEGRTLLNCFPPMIEYNSPGEGARRLVNNAGKLVFDERNTWLRLKRRGPTISVAMSHDGEKWQEIPTVQTTFPPRVKVGVHAINNSKNELNVELSELKLTQP